MSLITALEGPAVLTSFLNANSVLSSATVATTFGSSTITTSPSESASLTGTRIRLILIGDVWLLCSMGRSYFVRTVFSATRQVLLLAFLPLRCRLHSQNQSSQRMLSWPSSETTHTPIHPFAAVMAVDIALFVATS